MEMAGEIKEDVPDEQLHNATAAHPDEKHPLWTSSFIGLLVTQFLGATNDNVLRWLVIGIGKQMVTAEKASTILSVGSACFVLPYLLLAAPAGFLADRFNKRSVIVGCKFAEIGIMLAAVAAIVIGNIYLLFAVIFLMGAQSALFGPSKLGSIPEMLHASKISSANAMIGVITVGSTVLGTIVGNWLIHPSVTGAFGQERWWISAVVLIGFSILGWGASHLIGNLKAANPLLKFPWNIAKVTFRDLKTLWHSRALFRVSLGLMFFWTLGMLASLNIDQFGTEGVYCCNFFRQVPWTRSKERSTG